VQAGLDPPEFECRGGEMLVRFHPTRYVPPTRAGHELSALQRALLEVLAQIGPASLKQVRASLPTPAPERTVQDNLQLLRSLGLVELTGQRRTARWVLKGVGPWPAGGSPPDVSNDVSNVSNDVL